MDRGRLEAFSGIVWVNHHALLQLIPRVTRTLLFLNLLLLMFVVLMPFATGTASEYLAAGGDSSRLASALWAATLLGMALGFAAMFEWVLRNGDARVPTGAVRQRARIRFGIGTLGYVAAVVLAFVDPVITLVLIAAVAIYYLFEQTSAAAVPGAPE